MPFYNITLRWKNPCPLSADGNYRPLDKARQQQNISMRRQENHRWMSELSYVEEKEQWQEQINQLKKHLEFSVSVCQTLMQDQQVYCKNTFKRAFLGMGDFFFRL